MPVTTTAMAYWPRTTSTVVAPVQTLVEGLVPEGDEKAPPSSKLPNIRVEYCSPLVMMDVSWPRTKQGMVSKMPCPPGTIGKVDYRESLLSQQHELYFVVVLAILLVKNRFDWGTQTSLFLKRSLMVEGSRFKQTAKLANLF